MKGCGTFQDLRHLPRRPLPQNIVDFGRELRVLRQKYDISMRELAQRIGGNVARLSDVETGTETDPRFQWCDYCDSTTWRKCQRCGGVGYVERKVRA